MVDSSPRAYTRRQMLRGGVLIGGLAVAQSQLGPSLALAQQLAEIRPPFVATARRFDDFLHLRFEGHNLRQHRDGRLYRIRSDAPVHLVVVFPPQAVAEVSYESQANPPAAPVVTRLTGTSWLAFEVPPEALPLEATLDALLAWSRFDLRVAPAAVRPEGLNPGERVPAVRPPSRTETAIEMPWRLILSPHADSAFVHEPAPVTANDRTQLWHTRLAARPGQRGPLRLPPSEWERRRRTVRAIHAVPGDVEGITPPSAEDRQGVVIQTTSFSSDRHPKPIAVERMMLSALGGWLEGEGTWPRLTTKTNLVGYRHELAQGRDQYVKVENAGWLYPFGHLAVSVIIAERVFVGDGPGAFLRRKQLLVVAQPSKRYGTDHAPGQPNDGRAWPFRQLTFVTRRTPPIGHRNVVAANDAGGPAFVPILGSQPLLFQVRGEDWAGRTSSFDVPVIFVPNTRVFGDGAAPIEEMVAGEYRKLTERRRDLAGQRVAIAPPRVAGDTTVKMSRLRIDGEVLAEPDRPALFAAGQPPWYPVMDTAAVTIPAAQTARPDEPDAPVEIRLFGPYVDKGLDIAAEEIEQNAAGIYAELVEQVPLPFPPDAAGGVLSPNLLVSGLSRELGVTAGALEALTKEFNPEHVFAGLAGALEAKLLGAIPLADIVDVVPLTPPDPTASGEVSAGALKIVSRTLHPGGDTSQLPEAIETKLDWDPPLIEDKPGLFFEPRLHDTPATLTVDARFVSPLGPGGPPASYEIVGDLANFAIHLLGRGVANGDLTFMVVRFNRLRFDARTGQKPALDPDIADVRLVGPLRFVEELRHYLASLTNVPGIDVSPAQISAVYDLALPSVAIGPFALSNVAISAGVIIPFDNTPVRARFGVSSADDPFNLTVAFFSGGGYGAIAVGADGVEKLELSLEFGAQAAIDLVVASGSVSLMAGIVFKLSEVDDPGNPGQKVDSVELAGFLRLRGELSVLGLVSISASFTLTLGYETETNSAYGKGSFIVEIDVVLFSDTVEVEVERRFGGSPLPQEQAAAQDSTAQVAVAPTAVGPAAPAAGFVVAASSSPAAAPAQSDGRPPPPTFAQQVSKTQWTAYARAFA